MSYAMEMTLKSKGLWDNVVYSNVWLCEAFLTNEEGDLNLDSTAEQAQMRLANVDPDPIVVSVNDRKNWNKNEEKTTAIISKSLGELFQPLIKIDENKKARNLWTALTERCQDVNGCLKVSIENQYNKSSMED